MKTIIELTRTSLRCMQVDGQARGARVSRFVVKPLQPGQSHGEQLAALVQESKVERTGVIVCVPREQVITRVLRLPATRAEELAQIVELSGKAQLPYPREQAVADYQVIEQQGGSSTVQLIACHRELLDQHVGSLSRLGIEPAIIVPSSWGVFAWYQRLARSAEIREPAMLVHVDADHTDLVMVGQERLLFSRSLTQSLDDWRAGPDALGPLAQEIERSVSSLRKDLPGVDMQSLVITGLGPLDQWRDDLAKRLGKPVVARAASPPSPAGPDVGASPVVGLGLAVADPRWLPNLLPREARHAQSTRRHVRQATVSAALLLIALFLGAALLWAHVARQQRATDALLTMLRQLEITTRRTEGQQQTVEAVDRILASRRLIATTLTDVFQTTPPDVLLHYILLDRARSELIVHGQAPNTRSVIDYLHMLEQSGQFANVELRYSMASSSSRGAATEFELVAGLRTS